MYTEFELSVPRSLHEVLADIACNDISVLPIAGGTNLIIDIRARRSHPKKLVSLANVVELRQISQNNGHIEIGGGTTISDILYSNLMPVYAPSLHESAKVFAGQMVRNTGTVAGNICSGSPAADMVPPLLTLDALVTLTSIDGEREIPLSDFYTGFKQNVRRPNEIITKIRWDKIRPNSANYFYKLGLRKGDAVAIVGVAVLLDFDDDVCNKARIAFNSVAPVVMRAIKTEILLEGQSLSEKLIDDAADYAVTECSPIDDIRASAQYRKHCVRVLTRRLLNQALQQNRK